MIFDPKRSSTPVASPKIVHGGRALRTPADLAHHVLLHLDDPEGRTPWLDWPLFLAGIVAIAAGIGVVESIMARLRLRYVPSLLIASAILCVFGFFLTLA